jgi:hypothetical protein
MKINVIVCLMLVAASFIGMAAATDPVVTACLPEKICELDTSKLPDVALGPLPASDVAGGSVDVTSSSGWTLKCVAIKPSDSSKVTGKMLKVGTTNTYLNDAFQVKAGSGVYVPLDTSYQYDYVNILTGNAGTLGNDCKYAKQTFNVMYKQTIQSYDQAGAYSIKLKFSLYCSCMGAMDEVEE